MNWKRKTSYKNTHKREFVDVNRVFSALEYLIQHNPLYKDSIIDKNFLDSCKLQDPAGHDFFVGPNQHIGSSDSLTGVGFSFFADWVHWSIVSNSHGNYMFGPYLLRVGLIPWMAWIL